MARAILIMGEEGTGKTRSIKNLNPSETVIIKPNSKELPFRGASKMYIQGVNMFTIQTLKGVAALLDQINKAPQIKNVIIEDLTHYHSKRVVDEGKVTGYGKWTDLAKDTKDYIIDQETKLRPDLNLIIIGHVSVTQDASGKTTIGLQTPGKLMDNVIKIPSYFTYVLHTDVTEGLDGAMMYRFLTNKDGSRSAKTPEGCFPKFIENDLKVVLDGIAQYQIEEGLTPVGTTLEETKAKEEEAEKVPPVEEKPAETLTGEPEPNPHQTNQ